MSDTEGGGYHWNYHLQNISVNYTPGDPRELGIGMFILAGHDWEAFGQADLVNTAGWDGWAGAMSPDTTHWITPTDDLDLQRGESADFSFTTAPRQLLSGGAQFYDSSYAIGGGGSTVVPGAVLPPAVSVIAGWDGVEGERPVGFTLSRNDPTGPLDVSVRVEHRFEAEAPTTTMHTVQFLAGEAEAALQITPVDDAVYTPNRVYTLTVEPAPSGTYRVTDWDSASAWVKDNEPAPYVWIEGAADAVDQQTVGYFRLHRSDTAGELTVTYELDPAATTATEGSDFLALSRTVTFPAAVATVDVFIDVRQAAVVPGEPVETVGIVLVSATKSGGGQVPVKPGTGPKPVIIVPPAAGAPWFHQANYEFFVGRPAPAGTIVGDVQFTVPGGFDKIEISQGNPNGLFKIDPIGQTTGRITTAKVVPLYAPDQYVLQVRVTDRAGQTATANVTVRVRTLVVIYGDSDAAEGRDDGIHLYVNRMGGWNTQPLDVYFKYTWGTAVAADLEQPLAGTPAGALWKVTIPAGSREAAIWLYAATDVPLEGVETFRVELQESPTGEYALLNGMAVRFDDMGTHRGERNIDARILDGLTLFAADNATPALKDLDGAGQLRNPGISTNDIMQGLLFGDCDFLAPVIALVQRNPAAIAEMMTLRHTPTGPQVDVKFYASPTRRVTVTVALKLTNGSRQAELSGDFDAGRYEVWPQILESAYAKFRYGSDMGRMEDGVTANDTWKHLTGREVEVLDENVPLADREARIRAAVAAGRPVILYSPVQTQKGPDGIDIPGSHAFTVVSIQGNNIHYRNPHNYGVVPGDIRVVTFAQLPKYFPGQHILP